MRFIASILALFAACALAACKDAPGAPTAVDTAIASPSANDASGANQTAPRASASSPSARWRAEDASPLPPQDSITLGNVVPKNGEVIISMHYQTGMRASPGRVQVERAAWGDNPLDFVRLKLAAGEAPEALRATLATEKGERLVAEGLRALGDQLVQTLLK
jgi:hypothetical protein